MPVAVNPLMTWFDPGDWAQDFTLDFDTKLA